MDAKKFNTTKIRRGYWRIENDSTNYATIEYCSAYDASHVWGLGWHIRLRDNVSGKIVRNGACHASRKAATNEAIELLSTTTGKATQ